MCIVCIVYTLDMSFALLKSFRISSIIYLVRPYAFVIPVPTGEISVMGTSADP